MKIRIFNTIYSTKIILTKTYIPKSILDSFKSAAMELTEGGLTLSKSISVMYKLLFKSLHSFANCRWMLLFLFKDFFFGFLLFHFVHVCDFVILFCVLKIALADISQKARIKITKPSQKFVDLAGKRS